MKEAKKEIYNDVWFFYKKYLNGNNKSDAYWEQVNSEAQEIANKYNGDMFARELISAVIVELAREEKK